MLLLFIHYIYTSVYTRFVLVCSNQCRENLTRGCYDEALLVLFLHRMVKHEVQTSGRVMICILFSGWMIDRYFCRLRCLLRSCFRLQLNSLSGVSVPTLILSAAIKWRSSRRIGLRLMKFIIATITLSADDS